ncbi:hypothetical protein FA95DRAFT_713991 [Auriscalpium vulgare]|uniref:Uncharacterized protein n=1 Tax=Auriscalpium vulgare TaxID=40419 RepID=A0ACB8RCE8_9AGAM|nr:hypothetical protein FA95DRAFT_713991 [Auriscalpium vulgare]
MTESLTLLLLPDDALHAILLELDYRAILSCQATCRRLKNLIESSLDLLYTIELGASALCEGPAAAHLNVSERLRRLRSYEADRAKDIKFEELPFVPFLAGGTWDLICSVTTLVSFTNEDNGIGVYVQQMPSVARGIEERHWKVKLTYACRVVAVDASQDLLVVMKTEFNLASIRMLTLSTGEHHPSASGDMTIGSPQLSEVPVGFSQDEFIEVFGMYCGAMSRSTDLGLPRLRVWNWMMGITEVLIHPPTTGPTFTLTSGFTFLNNTHIVIVSPDSDALLVYRFRTESPCPWKGGQQQADAIPSAIFKVPYSIPFPPLTLNPCRGVSGTSPAGIFYPDPSARLFSLIIAIPLPRLPNQPSWEPYFHRLSLAVSVERLIAHTLLVEPAHAAEAVPWARWGSAATRLSQLHGLLEYSTVPLASGMRTIVLEEHGDLFNGTPLFAVADYCPVRVRRQRLLGTGAGTMAQESFEKTNENGEIIKTMLPCVMKHFAMPWLREDRHYRILLCEDQLFVLEADNTDNITKAWACTV